MLKESIKRRLFHIVLINLVNLATTSCRFVQRLCFFVCLSPTEGDRFRFLCCIFVAHSSSCRSVVSNNDNSLCSHLTATTRTVVTRHLCSRNLRGRLSVDGGARGKERDLGFPHWRSTSWVSILADATGNLEEINKSLSSEFDWGTGEGVISAELGLHFCS